MKRLRGADARGAKQGDCKWPSGSVNPLTEKQKQAFSNQAALALIADTAPIFVALQQLQRQFTIIGLCADYDYKSTVGQDLVYSDPMSTHTCPTCNIVFLTRVPGKIYCSERCRPTRGASKVTRAFGRWSQVDIFGDKKHS